MPTLIERASPAQRTANTARFILLLGALAWASAIIRSSIMTAIVATAIVSIGLAMRSVARQNG